MLLICHSLGHVIFVIHLIVQQINTENKQEITKGRSKEQEKLGEAGDIGATFLVVLVLFWYLHQAQMCSLAEKRASGYMCPMRGGISWLLDMYGGD